VVAAAAATAIALAVGHGAKSPQKPQAKPPVAAPVATTPAPLPAPRSAKPDPAPKPAPPSPPVQVSAPPPTPSRTTPPPSPTPTLTPTASKPVPQPPPTPPSTPTPTPTPTAYKVDSLGISGHSGDQTQPTIRLGGTAGSWWWDRWGLRIAGTRYEHGITVHIPSKVTIDLNRTCVSYDAKAGLDDLTRVLRTAVRFSVYGDSTRLWTSGVVRSGDPAVPVHVGLAGCTTVKLVVTPEPRQGQNGLGAAAGLADWADSVINCV
jgi:hypothetical protein